MELISYFSTTQVSVLYFVFAYAIFCVSTTEKRADKYKILDVEFSFKVTCFKHESKTEIVSCEHFEHFVLFTKS